MRYNFISVERISVVCFLLAASLFGGCGGEQAVQAPQNNFSIVQEPFGTMPDSLGGADISLFTISDGEGLGVKVTNLGAVMVAVYTPNRNGESANVAVGYDTLDEYLNYRSAGNGGTVGRVANRIANATFTLDGIEYQLVAGYGGSHLHGGPNGFHTKVFEPEVFETPDSVGVHFHMVSPDGDAGYPGNLDTTVSYYINKVGEFRCLYEATTDKPTIVNMTSHTYFNLSDPPKRDVLDEEMMINADNYTVTGEGLIPTGEIAPVAGLPIDFRTPMAIGARIEGVGNYDNNFVLNKGAGGLTLATSIYDPTSGRFMELYTTQPGLQLHIGSFRGEGRIARDGVKYGARYGFAIEPQHYPDSPHHPEFPSIVLRPGEKYQELSVYRFTTR